MDENLFSNKGNDYKRAQEIVACSTPHILPTVSMDSTTQSVRRHKVQGINDYADFSSPDKIGLGVLANHDGDGDESDTKQKI